MSIVEPQVSYQTVTYHSGNTSIEDMKNAAAVMNTFKEKIAQLHFRFTSKTDQSENLITVQVTLPLSHDSLADLQSAVRDTNFNVYFETVVI